MILQIADVKEIGRYEFGSCASLFGLRRVIMVLSFHAMGSSPVSHDLLINFNNINILFLVIVSSRGNNQLISVMKQRKWL